jgi:hypothetical protein
LVVSAFGASPASPAADPENFRVSISATIISSEGGTIPVYTIEGSAVFPQLGAATGPGLYSHGCDGIDQDENGVMPCYQSLIFAAAPLAGTHGGSKLVITAADQWRSDEPEPAQWHWQAVDNCESIFCESLGWEDFRGYEGGGTYTIEGFTGQWGSEFTINLTGTLRLAQ